MRRGYFSMYNYDRKKQLYLKYKDKMFYNPKLISFEGKIKIDKKSIDRLIDWKAYEKKKEKAIEEIDSKKSGSSLFKLQRNKLITHVIGSSEAKLAKSSELASVLDMNDRSVYDIYVKSKRVEP
jgi:hypothetical protein